MNRRDKTNYYLDMAQVALERGTCLRRNFGAVIVKNDVIVSTGYTGAPRGRANCIDIGTCIRQKMGIPRGERRSGPQGSRSQTKIAVGGIGCEEISEGIPGNV